MKRDASVKVVFLLRKKTTFTEASLFIFGLRTDVTALCHFNISDLQYIKYDQIHNYLSFFGLLSFLGLLRFLGLFVLLDLFLLLALYLTFVFATLFSLTTAFFC